MVKGKTVKNKQDQESMDPPMSRALRSRKRGYPVQKITDDHHQDLGEANTEDSLAQCHQEGDTKCIESLNSSSVSDEKNGQSETPEVTLVHLKGQVVISLSDCGHEHSQNKIEEEKIPNECESPDSSDDHIDINAGLNPNGSEEQISAEDNPNHKMETNQELDEVKLIYFEPVVMGSAKKRRRMGMSRMLEKEQSLLLSKCANRAERSEKQNENTVVVEEEKGSTVEVLSPHQQTTEMMQQGNLKAESKQNQDDRGETRVETAATGMTTMCEPLRREMHISENDPKGDLHSVITKPHDENASQKKVMQSNLVTEPGCQMIVAATMCESSLAFCESENTKVHDYSIVNHHYAEEELTRGRTAGQVCATVCKGHTDSDLRQTSDQQQKLEHQHNQTEAEASSSNSENYEPAQKPHLDKEQLLSRSECHFTATLSLVADSLYESQNPELQTTKIHLDGPSEPDPTAEFSNTNQKNMMNEQEPQKEVKVAVIDKQHENKNADEDHSHSENSNTKTNPIKEASKEQEPLHQLDTCNNTFLETFDQIIGENSHLLHTSLSDVPETNCSSMDKGHMNSICEEKEQHDINCSTVCMEPPQSREYVSDSQLNTIDMTDQVMGVITRVSPECYEDVTDLVGGLIRELSSLNRMVMATHRELENLRRRAKSSKNTLR